VEYLPKKTLNKEKLHTSCTVSGKVCSLFIDEGSYANVVLRAW